MSAAGKESEPRKYRPGGSREDRSEQIAGQAELFAKALVKSFRYSKGAPFAQAEYMVWLKHVKGIDLLAFSGAELVANDCIQGTLLAAFRQQHPRKAAMWDALDWIIAAEVNAVLNIARRLEGEGYRGQELI